MSDNKFDLGDYVEVKDRIARFYDLFGQGRIETAYELTREPDDKPKVVCRALAYRTPDDAHPASGTSWLYLPGTTPYTKGSEIENAETSAVGRAIGFLGILIDRSIASANEVRDKSGEEAETGDGSLIGIAESAKAPHDFELRQSPDGSAIGFKLIEGRQNIRVIAKGDLADALALVRDDILGQRVQCYGLVTPDEWIVNKGKPNERRIPYLRVALSRIVSPTVVIPSDAAREAHAGPVEPEVAGAGPLQAAPVTPHDSGRETGAGATRAVNRGPTSDATEATGVATSPAATDPDLAAFQAANPSLALLGEEQG